jgi:hypothetical protein
MDNSFGNKLHLVAFNIPYPADNGGLIDVFCKIKALKKAGIQIILHCYEYGRPHADELNRWCEEVFYYPRSTGKSGLFNSLPYIVVSRRSEELVSRLAADGFPILLEGLHCCGILEHPALRHKKMFVRSHNIEHDYYRGLANVERNIFKRYYFSNEAEKLERFEPCLTHASGIFAISKSDTYYFLRKYPKIPVWNVPAFHLNDEVKLGTESNEYALYHGSLDVGENNYAALKLVKEVFDDLPYTLIIAGKNPSKELRQACEGKKNIILKSKVNTEEIHDLVSRAHINVLPTWQNTGIKLKLLMALFSGRHCLVNDIMVNSTGLEKLCRIENSPEDMKTAIKQLFSQPFTEQEFQFRKSVLEQSFSNHNGAEIIKKEIFS